MSVSKEQVLATAALSRLDLSVSSAHARQESPDERVRRIAAQLDAVVAYMDILNQIDTDGIQPLYSPIRDVAPPREDRAAKKRDAEAMLANAPKRRQCFFSVPPII